MSPFIQYQNLSAASLSASKLRRRYIVALSLIAILTIVSQVVMQFLIADQKYDSRIVNIAGRQRMLSQKIAKLSYYISNAKSPDAASPLYKELEDVLSLWERSHVALLRGDSVMGLPGNNSNEVKTLFGNIQPHHEAIIAAAKAVLSSSGSTAILAQSLQIIKDHESGFLRGMDDIVFLYDQEASAKFRFVKWLGIVLVSVTLLVLMLEATFIFAPAARRIQRDMQELANRAKTDLGLFFSVSPTALLLVDNMSLKILHANQKATSLIGTSNEEITKANLKDYLDVDYDANRHFLEKIIKGENLNEFEVALLDAQGSVFETLVSVRAISFLNQSVFVLGITNISELKKAQQTLEHYATFDELTGLMNRRTGLIMLSKAMARFRRDNSQLIVCFVDLDGLKVANDNFGHAEGDWLIRTAAEVFTNVMRSSDSAIRLGGDEFLLILHNCSPAESAQLLARAETRLREIAGSEHKLFPVSFSYGIAAYKPEKHTNPNELISEADGLMYQAKLEKKASGANITNILQ